jgi:hypothetical protein
VRVYVTRHAREEFAKTQQNRAAAAGETQQLETTLKHANPLQISMHADMCV